MTQNRKIRVLHYCKGCSLGGTEKTAEIFCRHLDPDRFEVHFASLVFEPPRKEFLKAGLLRAIGVARYRQKISDWASANARVPNFQRALGRERVHLAPDWPALRSKILRVAPDLLHIHYGGDADSPIADLEFIRNIPAVVATHVFEKQDSSPGQSCVKKMLFVTRWLWQQRAQWATQDPRAGFLYNPLEPPASEENLRTKLGIPGDSFVVGRIGRPSESIYHPISIEAYARVEQPGRTFFLAVAPPQKMISAARQLRLRGFIPLPATVDDVELSRFYNTIDVLAHARKDGETFGLNIAESMRRSLCREAWTVAR
jgi:glycosyltransferase involved in cell wall biosynthesis